MAKPALKQRARFAVVQRAASIATVAVMVSLPYGAPAARTVALTGIDFHQLDLNRDGYIDRREAGSRPEFAALLKSADKDGDGRLSESEFRAAQKLMKPGRI